MDLLNGKVQEMFPGTKVVYEVCYTINSNYDRAHHVHKTMEILGIPAVRQHSADLVMIMTFVNEVSNLSIPINAGKLGNRYWLSAVDFVKDALAYADKLKKETGAEVGVFLPPIRLDNFNKNVLTEYICEKIVELSCDRDIYVASFFPCNMDANSKKELFGTSDGIHPKGANAPVIITNNVSTELLVILQKLYNKRRSQYCCSFFKDGKCKFGAGCLKTFHVQSPICCCVQDDCKLLHSKISGKFPYNISPSATTLRKMRNRDKKREASLAQSVDEFVKEIRAVEPKTQ